MADVGQILIVGGGIAGLTLAAALHHKGFRAELVELSPQWQAVGAGILVHANGMRVLHALGLGKSVEQAGAVVRWWTFCDDQGGKLSKTDLKELWGDTGACIGIERTRLQQVLVSGAAAVPCRLGTSVVSLRQDAHHVSVKFTDGSHGEYDLVVGADGIGSVVRALTLGTASPADLGAMNWRSIVPTPPSDSTSIEFLLGDGCFFGLCPVGEGHTYGFGYVMQPRFRDPVEGRLERLRQRFASFGKQVQEYLASLENDEQIHCAAMEWVEVDQWYDGRVVLIGDAAHASSPLMGQGGCMAMEDAWVLADELRLKSSVQDALRSYTQRRKERVRWVQQQSMATGEGLRSSPAKRDALLRQEGDRMLHLRFGPLVSAP